MEVAIDRHQDAMMDAMALGRSSRPRSACGGIPRPSWIRPQIFGCTKAPISDGKETQRLLGAKILKKCDLINLSIVNGD